MIGIRTKKRQSFSRKKLFFRCLAPGKKGQKKDTLFFLNTSVLSQSFRYFCHPRLIFVVFPCFSSLFEV